MPVADTDALVVSLSNIRAAKGSIYFAVYDRADSFLKTEQVRWEKIMPVNSTGSLDIAIPGLPPGIYAVSCFHDLNDNGKLDTNLFGVPTEPYGFSNNARPKFRAPYWEETNFALRTCGTLISIKLEKW